MILLTQEAIDKINGLTPGGGAEYTAGSGIAISSQNVISNTAQFNPTNAGTTGQVLKKIGNSYSRSDAEGGAMFITQEEYDALPSSKLTDGIEYIIVDTHCELLDYGQLIALGDHNDVLAELNTCPEGYFYYVRSTGIGSLEPAPTLPSGKYATATRFSNVGDNYSIIFTNLTVQELVNLGIPQATAEDFIEHNGEWTYSSSIVEEPV